MVLNTNNFLKNSFNINFSNSWRYLDPDEYFIRKQIKKEKDKQKRERKIKN